MKLLNNDECVNPYPKKLTKHELSLVVESFLDSNDFILDKGYPIISLGHDVKLERVLELRDFLRRKGYTIHSEQYKDDDVILPIEWLRV